MCWIDVRDAKVRDEVQARIDVDPNAICTAESKSRYVVLALTFAAGVFVGWLLSGS